MPAPSEARHRRFIITADALEAVNAIVFVVARHIASIHLAIGVIIMPVAEVMGLICPVPVIMQGGQAAVFDVADRPNFVPCPSLAVMAPAMMVAGRDRQHCHGQDGD